MRLLRLALLRYGHLADTTLDFSGPAGLHVVHGANEAGKSTALHAIADGLFGFGHRTEFDFLHGAQNLRVGFTLRGADGFEASFVRRKGRGLTLRDADDAAVGDEALRRFLGGASRELFERGFGLNGARLRAGGEQLLRSGGEAGESLLAGAGLADLRRAMAQLDDRARRLVGDRKGPRLLSDAVEKWRAAQKASDAAAVPPRDWAEAERAQAEAAAALSALQARAAALATEDSRLNRVRRIKPVLTALDGLRAEAASYAGLPALPRDAGPRMAAAVAAQREAGSDVRRSRAEQDRVRAALAGLRLDAPVLAEQDRVDALERQRGVAEEAARDLPMVLAEIAEHRAVTQAAAEELGLQLAPEAARDALPSAAARREVLRLIAARQGLLATAAVARRRYETALLNHRNVTAELARAAAPEPPRALRATIDEVRGAGKLDAELERAARAAHGAGQLVATALAALPLWQGDLAGLLACALPLAALEEEAASRLLAAQAAMSAAQRGVAAYRDELGQLRRALARLEAGSVVPTPDALRAARAARDAAWRDLRGMLATGRGADEAALAGFETLRDAADSLADRRADEARRVAEHVAATTRRALLESELAAACLALAEAEAEQGQAASAWNALWAPCGLVPAAPAAMAEWRRLRGEVVALEAAAAAARAALAESRARHQAAMASLASFMPARADETLAAFLLRAELACAAQEEAARSYQAIRVQAEREAGLLPEHQREADAAAAGLAAWSDAWAAALRPLGQPAEVAPERMEAALEAWSRIAALAPVWRKDAARVRDMRASVDGFAGAVRDVRLRLGEADDGEAAPMAVARLARRLAAARSAQAQAEALLRQLALFAAGEADAAALLDQAAAELAALRDAVGAADDAALALILARAAERDRLHAASAERLRELLAAGDGLSEAALRAEADGIDADAAVARLDGIGAERRLLDAEREQLSVARTLAWNRMQAMQQGGLAARHAQAAQDALAEARDAAAQYARLHLARSLLRAGIDRFREARQGPLLHVASGYFARLTGGRYARLGVDDDGTRVVLMALRPDGGECPVEALSEGTRDQLYLALRLAAIESQARAAEPLPVIGDDLLVHFDDSRATAALRLLAELGRGMQVILFTHHDHIAELAGAQEGVAVHRLK